MNQKVNLRIFLFLLPALASVTPLAMDTYLPSMPEIAESLNVGIEKIEVTISIFLIFYAFGQLFGGIVSDRLGRKKSALIGLLAFSLTSFALFF